MGSTGEPDRKRRHFSSLSSPTAAMAKKQPFSQWSEDKKLDAAVLQYQNQKLVQKLETQKVEYSAVESKLSQLQQNQEPYDLTLEVVNRSWESLIADLETCSNGTRDSSSRPDSGHISIRKDDSSSSFKDSLLSRLEETDATDTSCTSNCSDQMEEDRDSYAEKTRNILCNMETVINDRWLLKNALHASCLKELPEDGLGNCKKNESCEVVTEVNSLRSALNDLHLKHKSVARQLQNHQDMDATNKAQLKRLKGELESVLAELEDCNCKLATLKAEKDATKGTFFPVLNIGSKHSASDKARDKQKDLQEMESTLKELLDQASSQLLELKELHDERIRILQKVSHLQNSLKSVKSISSSSPFLLVRDQLEKSKSEVIQYQVTYEKLQVEKDNLLWRERELNIKNDLVDVLRRSSSIVNSKIADLRMEMQKQSNERNMIEMKLGDASKGPGRKEIIADFKALLSSFPEEMGIMQRQLSDFKEAASDIHSLRADVQSSFVILDRKVKECENLSSQSTNQHVEIQKLHSLVQYLRQSELELKLILEMYRRESIDPRDVVEAKDMEYKAWAQVQSLKSSLDEQTLELRVKTANEAEAVSQQRLAAGEAEIVDLRQKLEASKREMSKLSDSLKSKNEENEAFLSEIETIGQAYDDMQTQNQHLLQQITERDDYNIKLVLEGVKARQLRDSLLIEKRIMEREIQQTTVSVDFFDVKAARIEDQLRVCRDQVHKLTEDKLQNSVAAENTQKQLVDVRKSSDLARETLENSQSKLESSRAAFSDIRIQLERERFERRRIEENLEAAKRKILFLKAETENSPILQKLQEELREYREIVKCSICLDRPKEVVITKCYHLFCSPCVQKIIGSRHRKCPSCAASFGSNDVKPVYI